MNGNLYYGDSALVLPSLRANTFDALLTDPPASIKFMGEEWDSDKGGRRLWAWWLKGVMQEALRVMKPGAHGLVWAIPRRSHWTVCALEDAGFEIRDCIHHYFLSGFPKNLSVDKGIDKLLGYEREVIATRKAHDIRRNVQQDLAEGITHRQGNYMTPGRTFDYEQTIPSSPQAQLWEGWGTHLKPAIEHWWLVRKPLAEKSVAANILKWGTGALNIDASRIPLHHFKMDRQAYFKSWEERKETDFFTSMNRKGNCHPTDPGTFAGRPKATTGWDYEYDRGENTIWKEQFGTAQGKPRPADKHPDSRYPSHFIVEDWELLDDHVGFFHPPIYNPKARKCRNEGLERMPKMRPDSRSAAGRGHSKAAACAPHSNHHPTVKPVALMKYFATLLTQPHGHVLDCFMGSGSTGVACRELGLAFTGIELDPDYFNIAQKRLSLG